MFPCAVTISFQDPCIASMSWEDAREMVNTGFTVGVHSDTTKV